ncbi:MAG: hypothetical protein SX243_24425 [Acidobacteriota bacterium]|nr:hypothetical protein [Acidobacteriota bacterium]
MESSVTVWNSLEVAKLVASCLTPIALVLVAYFLNKRLKDIEQIQWANQKVVEVRIELFRQIAPKLNDLLCFFTYVGNWKELKPPDIVARKRELDREFHVNAPLFPGGVLDAYFILTGLCFKTFSGWGKDAKIRSDFIRREQALGENWMESWEHYFEPESVVELRQIQNAYNKLLVALSISIGVGADLSGMPRGRVPRGSQRRLADKKAEEGRPQAQEQPRPEKDKIGGGE